MMVLLFRWSRKNGHIEIAKWLYSLGGINISAKNDYAFRWICKYGYIEIAELLLSICGISLLLIILFFIVVKKRHIEIAK